MHKRKGRTSSPPSAVHQIILVGIIFFFIWVLAELAAIYSFQPQQRLPKSNHTVELYSNQTHDNLGKLYCQAIGSAKKSITLAIYGLTDHSVIKALQERCDAGIPVHIVCDAKASKGILERVPRASIVRRSGKGLMHQKILVVDNRHIWFGSANLTYSSLNIHANLILGLDHPPLAQALVKRTMSMDDEAAFAPLLHQETTAGNQALELWVLPDDQAAAKRLIELFRTAKKSIKVAMFTWTRTDFTQELIAASKRGINVDTVIDRNSGNGKGAKIVRMLQNGGIPVTLSTSKGLLHHKFAYIDDSILVNGSANWTVRAFSDNDDYFVIVHPLTHDQQLKMNDLWRTIKQQSERPILKADKKRKT